MDVAEPIQLKVMRLRRPHVEASRPLPLCSIDANSNLTTGSDLPKLLLPMALTQSLVGESFMGYLHLANHGTEPVADIILKVELQVGPSKFLLFDNSANPLESIDPGDFFDTDVAHGLSSAGTYVLTCNVSYTMSSSPDPNVFKRSYRFPALQPFAVVHRVVQMGSQLLVECMVENMTSGSIYLTSWKLDCAAGFEAALVGEEASRQTGFNLLKPRGAHNLVFKVAPKQETSDLSGVRDLELVGTLALGWHVPEGPSGCVEGHQIRVKPCGTVPLDLRVADCPRQVSVEVPFELEFEVMNRTSMPIEPNLIFDLRLMGNVKVHGPTHRTVGRVEPRSSVRVPLHLFVAEPGMHGLQGVSLVDDVSKMKNEFGVLCDILAF